MSPAPRVLQNHPAAGEAGSGSWFWMTRGLRVDRDGRRPLSTTRPTSAEGSPAASGSSSRHVSPHLATPAPPERLALLHSLSIVTVCVLPRPDKGLPRGSVLYYLVEWMAKRLSAVRALPCSTAQAPLRERSCFDGCLAHARSKGAM